jgi:PTH2 family peptidyl-tRNA hydrolase
MAEAKQVIIVRKDLKMRRGKECAQASHASGAWFSDRFRRFPGNIIYSEAERAWLLGRFTKVVCQVASEEALLDIYNKAKEKGLTVHLITDSGATEFNGVPTNTAVGIGPHWAEEFEGVTSHLKLY